MVLLNLNVDYVLGCPLFCQLSNFKSLTPENGSPWCTDKPEFFENFLLDGEEWGLELKVPKVARREKKIDNFFFPRKNAVFLPEIFRRSEI